ncbi:MAG: flagellin [Alphaproteobacteria bacterium]
MVTRIASFSHTNQLIQTNLRIQSNYAEAQLQVSTGLKSHTYQGIADDANQLLNLETDYNQLTTQTENAQIAFDRTETMFDLLGGVIDVAQGFLSDLGAALNGLSVTADQIQQSAEATLEQVAGILNSSVGDRYVFSGSATETPPIDLTSYGGALPPSAVDTSYYQGNNDVSSVEISNGFNVSYGQTADDPSIELILRALDLVITSPNDQNALTEAIGLLERGIDDVATLKASVAQDSGAIDQAIDRGLEELNLIDSVITDLKEVDLAEASTRVKELETQLEAAYSVTTGLLNLTIIDFIR